MLRIYLSAEDLGHIRLASSPLAETVMSYRMLLGPTPPLLYVPWFAEARRALRGLDLEPLRVLHRPDDFAEFLTPAPPSALPSFADELQRLRRTPPEQAHTDLRRLYRDGDLPGGAAAYLRDPRGAFDRLADLLAAYWEAVMAPHWPRVRTLLQRDLDYRARRLATEGPEGLFADLNHRIRLRGGTVEVTKRCEVELRPGGRGLVLLASAFCWPHVLVTGESWWATLLAYHARGLATLWASPPAPPSAALADLLGRKRAAVVEALTAPATTTDVARRLKVTSSAVSQQLARLRRAGVVEGERRGRFVYYRLSPSGAALLELFNHGHAARPTPGRLPGSG